MTGSADRGEAADRPRSLFDKLWNSHVVVERPSGDALLWIDRHFVHEGSFHAFNQLQARGGTVAEPGLTFGIADHYVPTRNRDRVEQPEIARMIDDLGSNTARHGIELFGMQDPRQGIVHVVGPEQGLTLPGLTMVCGDSHTSTHGAFGAYAFGIGASEVAHVLMTQTLWQKKPRTMPLPFRFMASSPVTTRAMPLDSSPRRFCWVWTLTLKPSGIILLNKLWQTAWKK